MPNNVTNRLIAPIETLRLLINEEGKVDFRLLLPCPAIVPQDSVGSHIELIAEITLGLIDFNAAQADAVASFDAGNFGAAADVLQVRLATRQLLEGPMAAQLNDAEFDSLLSMLQCHRVTGCLNWYDWNRKHWGTKWNAYESKLDGDVLRFETAWSAPHPVLEALSSATPKALIPHARADEDTGNNVGRTEYRGGRRIAEEELSGTTEGYELCFELNPGSDEYYQLQDGKYVYAAATRSGMVAGFRRDQETGRLTVLDTESIALVGPGNLGPAGLGISPEGDHLYVAAESAGKIIVFRRRTLD